jgi:putative membrane protein
MFYPMMFGYGDSWGWGSMILMFLWWLMLIVVFALSIRWLVIITVGGRKREGGDAVKILKERYAKGEIDKKEFEERYKTIKES